MIRCEKGFSLIELLITMAIFVIAIAAASNIFTGLLTQFKQQSKVAETSIEGIVGLEILRQDLESAGYGLPWNVTGVSDWSDLDGYVEAIDTTYNDAPNNPPRAILSGNNTGVNGSDYLVIKAINIARNGACKKSTLLNFNNETTEWDPLSENLDDGDVVIVISPGATSTNSRSLVVLNDGTFFTTYDVTANPDTDSLAEPAFAPTDNKEFRIVYGVDPDTDLRMPFNRADYYISTSNVPDRCATGTGVLKKATVNHANGNFSLLPLLDCVADFQVIFGLDNDGDGDFEPTSSTDGYSADITGLTAQEIREEVKEVRIYILAHKGQRDPDYTFNNFTCGTGCVTVGKFGLGSSFNLSTITDWENYKWRVYTLIVKPSNLS